MVNFAENYERLRDNLKDEKEASILVTKIRSELSDSENYLLNTNCFWQEHFLNSEIYSNGKHINYDNIKYSSNFGNSFNKLVNLSTTYRVSPYVKQFLPLRIFAFDDNKYICNVYSILWDVYTNKAKRIGVVDGIWYNYYINDYSISNATKKDTMINNIIDFIKEIEYRKNNETRDNIKVAYQIRIDKANKSIEEINKH